MRLRTTALLIGLVLPTKMFAQDEMLVNILPGKISTDISVVIPNGQSYIFEKYHYFKYVYWVNFSDTLYQSENGLLQGKRVTINPDNFSRKVDKCDTTINKIRNLAFCHRRYSELEHIARKEIGYDNREFRAVINKGQPTERQAIDLCNNDFRILTSKWFSTQSNKIAEIRTEKIKRQKQIKSNSVKVDSEYIKSFLGDFGFCAIDQTAIVELIEGYPDEFLIVCKELSDVNFFDVKLKLSPLPDNLKTDSAIEKLKASPIRTNRKRKLIRQLKKNAS